MKRIIFTLLLLAAMLLPSAANLADEMLVYPFQYADLDAYAAATGNSIDMWGEAPMLADQVAAGELPPVEERLPAQPAVVQPLEAIGEYGGELAGPTTNPTCCGWDVLEMRLQKLLTIDTDLTSIIPNIARAYEVSDDYTTFTFHLREGHRWSDGEPFTTEDFRFYFEDILGNSDVTASPGGPWVLNGELPQVDIIDESTVRMTYPEARPTLLIAVGSEVGHRGFRPAHYFKQFHLDYNEDANALAAENGFEDWVQMFNAKMSPYNFTWNLGSETDSYSPTLNSFVFVREDSFGNKHYERNAYFFKVDTAGNQLPYTDTLRRILVEDLQVQDLKAISGEYSHYGWGTLLSFPTYRENEEAGGYRTALAEYSRGNEYSIMFNFTTPNLELREIFWDRRFRQAMSVAINRDEINELVYFGLANASQNSPVPTSLFFEDWMPGHFAQYDPELANQLLDEMGLDQRDGDGFRLRPDGETLFLNFQVSVPEDSWRQIGELITSLLERCRRQDQLQAHRNRPVPRIARRQSGGYGGLGHRHAGYRRGRQRLGEYAPALGRARLWPSLAPLDAIRWRRRRGAAARDQRPVGGWRSLSGFQPMVPTNGWNWARRSIACRWTGCIRSARFSARRSRCSSRPT